MFDTVLVVENEAYILEAMTAILDSAGIESFAAKSAKEGVKLFQEHHQEIDLVILDWHLPGEVEGNEVLNRLQAIDPDVKVLISTGYDVRVIQERLGKTTTAVSILRKPYNAQTLLNAVQQEMRRDGGCTLSA
jgi:two-component system, cell cycle sensor histidine kinase and response regulator CckA